MGTKLLGAIIRFSICSPYKRADSSVLRFSLKVIGTGWPALVIKNRAFYIDPKLAVFQFPQTTLRTDRNCGLMLVPPVSSHSRQPTSFSQTNILSEDGSTSLTSFSFSSDGELVIYAVTVSVGDSVP